MRSFLSELRELIEDSFTTVFKLFLICILIIRYGPLFGIPCFVLSFSCYRILIYRWFKLIPLSPSDVCFLSNSNYERYNIIGVLKISSFNSEEIKQMIIEKAIKQLKRMRLILTYNIFNYYWREISVTKASKAVSIIENEIEDKDINKYIESELHQYIDIRESPPYEIKIIKIKNQDKGVVLFKFDHILSDGLGIISLMCSLDDNYNAELFPKIMKLNSQYELSYLGIILHYLAFIIYGPYSMFVMFFQNAGKTPFKSTKSLEEEFTIGIGKEHSLLQFNKIRKDKNLSFNQAIMSILSNVCYDICNNEKEMNKSQIKYIKCMIPVCRKPVPSSISKIKLSNEANFIYVNLPLINYKNKEEVSTLSSNLQNTLSNTYLNFAYLTWPSIISHFISFRVINIFSYFYFRNVDLIVSNIPGPTREIKYNGSQIESLYPVITPGKGVPFICVTSYNNKFVVTISISKKLPLDSKKIINQIEQKIIDFFH